MRYNARMVIDPEILAQVRSEVQMAFQRASETIDKALLKAYHNQELYGQVQKDVFDKKDEEAKHIIIIKLDRHGYDPNMTKATASYLTELQRQAEQCGMQLTVGVEHTPADMDVLRQEGNAENLYNELGGFNNYITYLIPWLDKEGIDIKGLDSAAGSQLTGNGNVVDNIDQVIDANRENHKDRSKAMVQNIETTLSNADAPTVLYYSVGQGHFKELKRRGVKDLDNAEVIILHNDADLYTRDGRWEELAPYINVLATQDKTEHDKEVDQYLDFLRELRSEPEFRGFTPPEQERGRGGRRGPSQEDDGGRGF